MIDEEDDEDILNKKRSWKRILKNVLLIVLIGIGVLFMYLGGPNQITNMVIGFTFICLGTSIFQMGKNVSDPIRQTLTILKCKSCSAVKVGITRMVISFLSLWSLATNVKFLWK